MRKICRKKRWLAAVLSLCLGISMLPAAAAETVSGSSLPVVGATFDTSWKELNATFLDTLASTSDDRYGALQAGKYYLNDDLTLKKMIVISNGDVTLDLNGHVLQGAGNKRVMEVDSGGADVHFTLQDSDPNRVNTLDTSSYPWKIATDETSEENQRIVTGGVITGGSDGTSGGGLMVSGGSNNSNSNVNVDMTGGSIVGCQVGKGATGGAGVAVMNSSANFHMSGGAIFGNQFNGNGDAVVVNTNATFRMSGNAYIASNGKTAVMINSGTMTQSGGTIQGNVYVTASNASASFTATDGTINGDVTSEGSAQLAIGEMVAQTGTVWYTVSFVLCDDDETPISSPQIENVKNQTLQKGACAAYAEPRKNEVPVSPCPYEFAHWYLDDPKVPYDFSTPVTKSITLYSHLHTSSSWKTLTTASAIQKAGTCTSAAIYCASECTVCGKGNPDDTNKVTGAPDPSNHAGPLGDWQKDATEHWRICTACQVETDRAAHTYVNGACSVCGATQPPAPAPTPTPGSASSGSSSSGSYTPAPTPTPEPTRPAQTVTVEQMGDVPKNVYFYDAVKWAAEMGITQGAADGSFKPYQSCSKNQLVTFLWRAAGCPKPSGADADTDGAYYSEAVKWAAEAGIFDAKGDAAGGSAKFSRQQVASIIYRYAKALGYDLTQGDEKLMLSYNADEMTAEDLTAFRWACSNGILQPADGYLMPDGTVNRSQLIAMLYRLMAEKTQTGQ